MGGRVAEEIIFNVQTTGASNDFEQATQMARAMVTEYGMSEKLGPVQYEGNHAMFGAQTPQKSISERTAYEIDEEVRALLNEARNKAAEIIQSNRETHKLIAEALLKYETLDSTQIKSLYETGKMPETVEARELKEMNERGEIKDCVVEGPISLDIALDKECADIKGFESPVAGDADVILVPNIQVGNILGKSITIIAKGNMAGFVVGAQVPIVFCSRGSSAKEKFLSLALAAAVSAGKNK